MKFNGLHQPVVYDDSVHWLGKDITTVKKSTLLIASKEVDLKINTGKPERMLPCREQNVVQSQHEDG